MSEQEFMPIEILGAYIQKEISSAPNMSLPSQELRDAWKDELNRVLWIDCEIDTPCMAIVKQIMEYNRADAGKPVEERMPIKLFIDTNGGSVVVMWTLIKAIKMSKTPVYTINISSALSAGAHILAAGHKRFAFPGSTVLIHSGSCSYSGTYEQADSAKKYYDSISKKAEDLLVADTKIDTKTLKKKAPSDWYLDEDDALKYGVVDKIVESYEEIL